jgi:hypothetical protein
MCNDHGNRIPYGRYVEEFSHFRLPVFVQGNGPDLTCSGTPRRLETSI